MSAEKTFKEQALGLVQTINEMSNPFLDNTAQLLKLDTLNVIDESVVNTVRTVEAVGRDQYNTYHKSVISHCVCSIHEPIKKLLASLQMPNTQDQDQAGRADLDAEG